MTARPAAESTLGSALVPLAERMRGLLVLRAGLALAVLLVGAVLPDMRGMGYESLLLVTATYLAMTLLAGQLWRLHRRIAIDAARARGTRPAEVGDLGLETIAEEEPAFERVLLAQLVKRALKELSPEHRAVIVEVHSTVCPPGASTTQRERLSSSTSIRSTLTMNFGHSPICRKRS